MNRTKISSYNALSALMLTIVNGVGGIIITSMIIKAYGSDFNGVNATVTQVINMLLIVEGGFTLAANVALFKPFAENNKKVVNAIMSATKKTFSKMGLFVMIAGLLLGVIYSFFIKSDLNYFIILSMFVMTTISVSFNLSYTTKYRLMFQVEQKEYVYSFTSAICYILLYLTNFILIKMHMHMLSIRVTTLLFSILTGVIVRMLYKREFSDIDFNVEPGFEYIKGTKDVLVQKLTSILYTSMPIFFISTFASTVLTSIYSIYNSVFVIIKSILAAVTSAPTMSFGDMISKEGKTDNVFTMFSRFDNIVLIMTTIFIIPTALLIIPFVSIYIPSNADVNYINFGIPALMVLITFFETIHLPSGIILNMSGNFKVSKKIQLLTMIIMSISLVLGFRLFEIYGILLAILISAICLCVCEISYIYIKFFQKSIWKQVSLYLVNLVLIIGSYYILTPILPPINGFVSFFLVGFGLLLLSAALVLMVNFFINRDAVNYVASRAKSVMLKIVR